MKILLCLIDNPLAFDEPKDIYTFLGEYDKIDAAPTICCSSAYVIGEAPGDLKMAMRVTQEVKNLADEHHRHDEEPFVHIFMSVFYEGGDFPDPPKLMDLIDDIEESEIPY